MITFLLLCCLAVLCWPLALLVLVLWPLVWLLVLPFRMLGMVAGGMLALFRALCFLPARILGYRGHAA